MPGPILDDLSPSYIRERLLYDPVTGNLTWRERGGGAERFKNWNEKNVAKPAGYNGGGYIKINIDGKRYLGHRLAWAHYYGKWPSKGIDHIDLNGLNNAILNLREASQSQNMMNYGAKRTNTSGAKGVTFLKKHNSYKAAIQVRGVTYHLGLFKELNEAAMAYRNAALEMHGEFARFE